MATFFSDRSIARDPSSFVHESLRDGSQFTARKPDAGLAFFCVPSQIWTKRSVRIDSTAYWFSPRYQMEPVRGESLICRVSLSFFSFHLWNVPVHKPEKSDLYWRSEIHAYLVPRCILGVTMILPAKGVSPVGAD